MYIVRLPRLGQTMEQGILNTWCVDEGADFAVGDALYEVETEKMNTEVEAKQDGILVRVVVRSGTAEVPVGTVLAVAAEPGETVTDAEIDAFLAAEAGVTAQEQEQEQEQGQGQEEPADSAVPLLPEPVTVTAKPQAVPAARHLARELGVDLAALDGSGAGGAVRVADVRAAVPPATHVGPAPAPVPRARTAGGPARVAARIPVQGVARAMADAMARSWAVPQFTQQISLDATALVARLKRLRYEGVPASYNDLIIAATARAATEVPEVNASFAGSEIVRYAEVNVSIAIATDRGLLVPVVRGVDTLPIADLVAETKDLAERTRLGKLGEADLSGGTITVSNLGAFGVDSGMPLLNEPQCALVFVGSLADRPAAVDGVLAVRKTLNVAIAYDHRVVDGMTAARFTQALRTRLEAGG